MRCLVLSDIHANIDALEAVLNAAPAHEAVWNLGDVVGYGAAPDEVIERVRVLGTTFVRGNHDRACSERTSPHLFNPIAARSVFWTRRRLTPEHIGWLQALAPGPLAPEPAAPDGVQVSCMHGSDRDEDEYLFSLSDAREPLLRARTQINFFGHTHIQGGFAMESGCWRNLAPPYSKGEGAECSKLRLRPDGRYLINPGSVGQPRDHDPRAAFAVFDGEEMAVIFHRVPYDFRRAQLRILNAGLPGQLAARLSAGR